MVTPVGATYATAKAAIIDLLLTVTELDNVAISYSTPMLEGDVQGDTGKFDSMYWEDTKAIDRFRAGEQHNKVVCGLPLKTDEDYELILYVQSFDPDEQDGAQRVVDRRVDEMLYYVFRAIWRNPSLGLEALEGFEFFQILSANFERVTGPLGDTPGHGSGARIFFQVDSRLQFYQ